MSSCHQLLSIWMYKLWVWFLLRANDLVSKDMNGFSNPYFEVKVNGECKYKSSIKKKTVNPIWDEMAIMVLPRAGELLEVVCNEYDLQNCDCKIVNYISVILLNNIMFHSTSGALGPWLIWHERFLGQYNFDFGRYSQSVKFGCFSELPVTRCEYRSCRNEGESDFRGEQGEFGQLSSFNSIVNMLGLCEKQIHSFVKANYWYSRN